jgi:hypothetical protein
LWRRAIVVVQPETVLRWHRAGFRLFWRRRSRPRKASPLPSDDRPHPRHGSTGATVGAERTRGELLKLGINGIKVSKRTIQKYMRGVRNRGGGGQDWATFLKNHAERMWVCDFIQTVRRRGLGEAEVGAVVVVQAPTRVITETEVRRIQLPLALTHRSALEPTRKRASRGAAVVIRVVGLAQRAP